DHARNLSAYSSIDVCSLSKALSLILSEQTTRALFFRSLSKALSLILSEQTTRALFFRSLSKE
ncbi:MAG: hypothetical protein ACRDHW_07960, partial [Ktedonobacteraceae bacterium]